MSSRGLRVPKKPEDMMTEILALENKALMLKLQIFDLQSEKERVDLLRQVLLEQWHELTGGPGNEQPDEQ